MFNLVRVYRFTVQESQTIFFNFLYISLYLPVGMAALRKNFKTW